MPWKPEIPHNDLPPIPRELDYSSLLVPLVEAHRYLAELKGFCQTLPNPQILLSTILVQESLDSSAIENIVTTQDELYKYMATEAANLPHAAKEVSFYRTAMYEAWEHWKQRPAISENLAVRIHQAIKQDKVGLRIGPGTALRNATTNAIIYTPPEWDVVPNKMRDWEKFVNDPKGIDPLVALAMQHYQFEAIHPFSDGNGRTGRVLNTVFLIEHQLLDIPILYLSRYIVHNKRDYYNLLLGVTRDNAWLPWIRYVLEGISETSRYTLQKIHQILELRAQTLEQIKALSQKVPAQALNDLLFSYPYVKIQFLVQQGIAQRNAAAGYLNALCDAGVLAKTAGKDAYYVNYKLLEAVRD